MTMYVRRSRAQEAEADSLHRPRSVHASEVVWTVDDVPLLDEAHAYLGTVRHRPEWVPASVALYITAAYWWSSSISFANPMIDLACTLSDTFAGIAPSSVPMFVLMQTTAAMRAVSITLCNTDIFTAASTSRPARSMAAARLNGI